MVRKASLTTVGYKGGLQESGREHVLAPEGKLDLCSFGFRD